MFFHQRFIPGLAIASYIVGDEKAGRAAVIDPTRDVQYYIELANREGLRIHDVLETHVHADFVSGARELKSRLGSNDVTIHCSGEGGGEWTPTYADRVVHDGDEVQVGRVRLQAVHTPGHTPEHVSWAVYDTTRSDETPWLMLTGDFLFVGDVGRPDLLGEQAQKQMAHELYRSVFERIEPLPDFTEIYPGHGAGSLCGKALGSRRSSTLGFERQFNAALQPADEPQWIDTLLQGMPPAPPYFKRLKQVNRQGPEILGPELPGRRAWSAAEVRTMIGEAGPMILDVRSKEAFAAGHIPGSINIGLAPTLATWAGWVLPYDRPILLVLAEPAQREDVVTQLIRIGLDDIRGYLEGGIEAWEVAGDPLERIQTLAVQELAQRLERDTPQRPRVLDVRSDEEWQRGHIEGALHIHLGQLPERMQDLPEADRPLAVICGSGYRASIATSLLQRQGHDNLLNVLGGMSAWHAAKLPLASPGPAKAVA